MIGRKLSDRRNAIRCIYAQSNKMGWDYDELHLHLKEIGYGEEVHLRRSPPHVLQDILERLFNVIVFVMEDAKVTFLEKQYAFNEKEHEWLLNYIQKRFNKPDLYHLSDKEFRGLCAMLGNYKKYKFKEDLKNYLDRND